MWEGLKEKIKTSAIQRSSIIVFEERMREKQLSDNLNNLCKLECENLDVGTTDINNIKFQLNAISKEKYRGSAVRARAEKLLCGEQPTKRALGAEELRYEKRNTLSPMRTHPYSS